MPQAISGACDRWVQSNESARTFRGARSRRGHPSATMTPAISFAGLFPDRDYAHHLAVKRGDVRRFFAATSEHSAIVRERGHWLSESPEKYAGALEGSEPFIKEAAAILDSSISDAAPTTLGRIVDLGRKIEPDIVLLEKQEDEVFKVVAGCVCFPSSWDFSEKLGKPLHDVHEVVPDLNQSIGDPIARFLGKIQPGASWERSNWGLSASAERNQHPSLKIPRLTSPVLLDQVWLRVEDQILSILPETGALLFGIRIVTTSLAELRRHHPGLVPALRRALATMPEAMARYKNIDVVREEILQLLKAPTR